MRNALQNEVTEEIGELRKQMKSQTHKYIWNNKIDRSEIALVT